LTPVSSNLRSATTTFDPGNEARRPIESIEFKTERPMRSTNTKFLHAVIFLAPLLLAACGGGSSAGTNAPPPTTTTAPPVTTTPPSGTGTARAFAYVANFSDGTVSIYSVIAQTGQLLNIATVASGAAPVPIAVASAGKFVYVANADSDNVSVFAVDPGTGLLTAVAGSSFATGTNPFSVTVDPAGQFAYTTNQFSNSISMFMINATTRGFTAIGTVQAGMEPVSLALAKIAPQVT
jgi:6-phosphogluconolactonase